MKVYSVTIPTTGYVTYLVDAESEADARAKVQATSGLGLEIQEEENGDWRHASEWDVEDVTE